MSFEDFKLFDEWSKKEQDQKTRVAAQAALPPPVSVTPASWGKRVGAYLIDSLILGIPLGILVLAGAMSQLSAAAANLIDPATGQQNPAAVQELTALILRLQLKAGIAYIILGGAYYILMHGLMGQTFGKMALGTKVVNEDGSPIDIGAAAKRAVVFPLASIVPYVGSLLQLLNGLWPLFEESKQSLGDKFAHTLVVNSRN